MHYRIYSKYHIMHETSFFFRALTVSSGEGGGGWACTEFDKQDVSEYSFNGQAKDHNLSHKKPKKGLQAVLSEQEKSTRPLAMASASCCRTSRNFDCLQC